jgi:hypothetical protein
MRSLLTLSFYVCICHTRKKFRFPNQNFLDISLWPSCTVHDPPILFSLWVDNRKSTKEENKLRTSKDADGMRERSKFVSGTFNTRSVPVTCTALLRAARQQFESSACYRLREILFASAGKETHWKDIAYTTEYWRAFQASRGKIRDFLSTDIFTR